MGKTFIALMLITGTSVAAKADEVHVHKIVVQKSSWSVPQSSVGTVKSWALVSFPSLPAFAGKYALEFIVDMDENCFGSVFIVSPNFSTLSDFKNLLEKVKLRNSIRNNPLYVGIQTLERKCLPGNFQHAYGNVLNTDRSQVVNFSNLVFIDK